MEILTPRLSNRPVSAALFDFDGTLSLLRRNWHQVMIPMMVDILVETETKETRLQLTDTVEEFVMRLNGKQTIYQMIELAAEVTKRGGAAREPLAYKHQYHNLLWEQVTRRVDAIASGRKPADDFQVPGSTALLQRLNDRGVRLFLASGTDIGYVRNELKTLQLDSFFEDRVYGALDDYEKFSKAMIVRQLIDEAGYEPSEIVGFGDGFVEIEEVANAGGYAIGVASNEETRAGVNAWKRDRLIRAGAQAIVGDYRDLDAICTALGLE